MTDDKVVPIQPDPFPLSQHPTIRIDALEKRCAELQSRLESSEKHAREMADAAIKANADAAGYALRLDSAQKLARAAWDSKSEGAMWQALSRIIDALEGTAVEKLNPIGETK